MNSKINISNNIKKIIVIPLWGYIRACWMGLKDNQLHLESLLPHSVTGSWLADSTDTAHTWTHTAELASQAESVRL